MMLLVSRGAGFIGLAEIRHVMYRTSTSVINANKLSAGRNLKLLADVFAPDRYAVVQVAWNWDVCSSSSSAMWQFI